MDSLFFQSVSGRDHCRDTIDRYLCTGTEALTRVSLITKDNLGPLSAVLTLKQLLSSRSELLSWSQSTQIRSQAWHREKSNGKRLPEPRLMLILHLFNVISISVEIWILNLQLNISVWDRVSLHFAKQSLLIDWVEIWKMFGVVFFNFSL